MADERAAGVRAPERQLAGKSTAELVAAAKATREIDSTYRVYVREWLHEARYGSKEAAVAKHEAKYAGRLRDEDWRIEKDPEDGSYVYEVRRWNVTSEWKYPEDAAGHMAALIADGMSEDEIEVVPRNSKREHTLRSYGVLKLAAA